MLIMTSYCNRRGLRYGKMGNKRRATCRAKLLQNELNSDVARFTTHIKPVTHEIGLLTGLNMGGKTCNIAIQIVLQQCCKTSCTLFVARFPLPLAIQKPVFSYLPHAAERWPCH